jgi:hypothetical protein
LTVAKEKDSYEIYSMLLRTEMPPQWNITAWVIIRETQTFPNFGSANGGSRGVCIETSKDQEPIYLSAIDDYVAKDKRKLVLERKFDLLQYALMGTLEISTIRRQSPSASGLPFNSSVIFDVSAVGFNQDGSRGLVYVGHHCGSLCGGGQYHLLVKKDGRWQVEREHHGPSCLWGS